MQSKIIALRKSYPGAIVKTHASVTEKWILFIATVCGGAEGTELATATRAYPASSDKPLSGEEALADALATLGITDEPSMPNLVIGETPAHPMEDLSQSISTDAEGQAGVLVSDAEVPVEELVIEYPSSGSPADVGEEAEDSSISAAPEPATTKPMTKKEKARADAAEVVFSVSDNAPLSLRKFDGKKMGEVQDEKPSIIKYLLQPGGKSLNLKPEIYDAAKILAK